MSEEQATIGDNNPPEPTPFEAMRDEINDLYLEARNWCDGTKIESQAQADKVAELVNMIRAAAKRADDLRKEESKPHDDAKAEIQARYNELIGQTKQVTGLTVKSLDALKSLMAPWLEEIDRKQREEADRKRREAEEAARKAQEELAAARAAADLEAREKADEAIKAAEQAQKEASRAEKAKANAKGGSGKAMGLRTDYIAVVDNYTDAGRYLWARHRDEFHALIDKLAQAEVKQGRRDIPGVTVNEIKRAV